MTNYIKTVGDVYTIFFESSFDVRRVNGDFAMLDLFRYLVDFYDHSVLSETPDSILSENTRMSSMLTSFILISFDFYQYRSSVTLFSDSD